MSTQLLTLIVPTYNRADYLERLLATLKSELDGLESEVKVLVSDNASTDRTPDVTTAVAQGWGALTVQRHTTNLGPDGNFCSCVRRVETQYFWIMSDDDCPKRGVVAQVVRLLKERQPALIYMQSEWLNPVTGPAQGEPVGKLRVEWMDTTPFAKAVHIWVTFISGMVVDKARLDVALGEHTIERFTTTHLVQLGWILPLLKSSGPFAFVHDRCILATKDNSGGYPLLTVFCVNFPRIVNETFGKASPLSQALLGSAMSKFLPGRIWAARTSASSAYSAEDPWKQMRIELGYKWIYWLLLMPIGRLPIYLAQPLYQSWRIFNRLRVEWMRLKSA